MARSKSFDETQILSKMMSVFWKQGYEATSMRHLEKATGLSSGSIYHEFGSKQKLFDRTLRFYINTVIDFRIHKHLENQNDQLSGIRQFMISSFKDVPGAFARQSCLLVNSAAELGQSDALIGKTIRQGFQRIELAMKLALQQAREQGQIKQDTDCIQTARLICLMLPGLLIAAKNGSSHQELEKLVDHALQHVTHRIFTQ